MDPMLQFLGRLHPVLLHAPIGVAIALASLELFARARGRAVPSDVRSGLAWLLALSAGASIGSGLLLHEEGGYRAPTVDLHEWLAISVGVLALLAAIAQQARMLRAYAYTLTLGCLVLIPAGHFGATLTHGEDFLTAPFASTATAPAPRTGAPLTASSDTLFARSVQPILERSCVACHGMERKKGGLALHSAEALLAGSEYGPVVAAGDPAASELIRRLHLPADDDEHMPPKSKPQLSPEEIKAIEDWIAAGASATAQAGGASSLAAATTPVPPPASAAAPVAVPIPDKPRVAQRHLAALAEALVHAEPVSRDSTLLVVSTSAIAPSIDDAEADRLLRPVAGFVADLDLSRSRVTDRTLPLIATMPNLLRLNLSGTQVTDAGVASLSKHPLLEDLLLTGTNATAAIEPSLSAMPSLKRVYLWKSAVTSDDAARWRARFPNVTFDLGDATETALLETEAEIKLTSDSPAPGAPKAADLKPVNTTCPVSDKPVDPAFAIVHEGKIVGFCCKHCLAEFLDDPAKFAGKVK